MLALSRLPYDVWQPIFDLLDKHTLLDAAQSSRSINELASLSLYRTVYFNGGILLPKVASTGGDPFDALKRRPHLRSAVREIRCSRMDWECCPSVDSARIIRAAQRTPF